MGAYIKINIHFGKREGKQFLYGDHIDKVIQEIALLGLFCITFGGVFAFRLR
jgi:hypothetical protein